MSLSQIKSIKYKSAFTLIELTLVLLIVGLILPIIFNLYTFISRANNEIVIRQRSIQESYELLEKLNVMMQNYTIDYEEYFDRQMAGCV